MRRQRTAKSTIRNDPFSTVIPLPDEPNELKRVSMPAEGPPPPDIELPLLDLEPSAQPEPPRSAKPTRITNSDRPKRPEPVEESGKSGKQKLTVHVDRDLAERVKNAAYWNPRLTIAGIATLGIKQAIEKIERDNGGRYEPREGELVGGRPIK